MTVLCLFIIQDIILDHVLKKYISYTPFLKLKKIKVQELLSHKTISLSDIIIIEPDFLENDLFYSIKQNISTKPTIFISDNNNLIEVYGHANAVYLKKSFNYSDFVKAISLLIDSQDVESIANSYS